MLIRVSNIDRSTSVDDIWDLFAEFGEVEEAEINDLPDPGKDTYTAYVSMPYGSEAKEAVSELNGERVDGKVLFVRFTESREDFSAEDRDPEDWDAEDDEDELAAKKAFKRKKGIQEIDD